MDSVVDSRFPAHGAARISSIYDRGRTKEGFFCIIMEYISEGTLKDRIAQEDPIPPPL